MALIRWQPFHEMETLRRQMDQLFDEFAGMNRETRATTWTPAIELKDENDHLVVRAEIPGVEAKDLDVQVAREAIAIAGENRYEKKTEENGFYRSEFRYGKFQRTIPLPVPVENDKVQADFNNGILTLTLPKAEDLRRKVFKVNLGDNQASIPASDSATEAPQG